MGFSSTLNPPSHGHGLTDVFWTIHFPLITIHDPRSRQQYGGKGMHTSRSGIVHVLNQCRLSGHGTYQTNGHPGI